MFGLEQGLINWESSQSCSFSLGDHHCEFELSDENSWLLNNDWVWDQELVVEAFLETESCNIGIFEAVQAETVRRISAEDFVEELSALLDFEIVSSVEGSFVDVGPDFSLNYIK